MVNHHTTTVFFEEMEIPVESLIGEEGKGFRYIIDGWNAERILVASESIGDGRWFTERASKYATSRADLNPRVLSQPVLLEAGLSWWLRL